MVKKLSAMQETWVRSLGQEDILEKEVETCSSIFAWRILWAEEPSRLYSPQGHKELDMTEATSHTVHKHDITNPSQGPLDPCLHLETS